MRNVWDLVDKSTGCWLWLGQKNAKGYAICQRRVEGRRIQKASHYMWYVVRQEFVPVGLQLCHRCDNPGCVNPEHLFLGKLQDNADDKNSKGRQARGVKIAQSKLTAEKVLDIRMRFNAGESKHNLAKAFGVSFMSIHYVITRKNWGWV